MFWLTWDFGVCLHSVPVQFIVSLRLVRACNSNTSNTWNLLYFDFRIKLWFQLKLCRTWPRFRIYAWCVCTTYVFVNYSYMWKTVFTANTDEVYAYSLYIDRSRVVLVKFCIGIDHKFITYERFVVIWGINKKQ